MDLPAARVHVARWSAGGTAWELAQRDPMPALRPWVRSMYGYVEAAGRPVLRRELPGAQIVVIFDLGPTIAVADGHRPDAWARHRGGFVAGLHDRFALTEHGGTQRGVQLDLTLLGGAMLLDAPMDELANRVVGLEDVLGPERVMLRRLREIDDWGAAFDVVERIVAARIARARTRPGFVPWALRRIERSGGNLNIGAPVPRSRLQPQALHRVLPSPARAAAQAHRSAGALLRGGRAPADDARSRLGRRRRHPRIRRSVAPVPRAAAARGHDPGPTRRAAAGAPGDPGAGLRPGLTPRPR
jgi:hypothetical protein